MPIVIVFGCGIIESLGRSQVENSHLQGQSIPMLVNSTCCALCGSGTSFWLLIPNVLSSEKTAKATPDRCRLSVKSVIWGRLPAHELPQDNVVFGSGVLPRLQVSLHFASEISAAKEPRGSQRWFRIAPCKMTIRLVSSKSLSEEATALDR